MPCFRSAGIALASIIAAILCAVALTSCSSGDGDEYGVFAVSETDIMITEVLASNSSSAKAYDGRYYDWIELYNNTSAPVSLDDYYISDDLDQLQKCSLKGQKIGANSYLIIYCSGLNITDETGCLHTNFKLSAANGETIYLSDKTRVISVTVPVSKPDVSYGLDPATNTYVWFDTPTPGQPNGDGGKLIMNRVIINEYMTSNTFTVYDCDGSYPDWIELYNPDGEPADMSGYGLTDDDKEPLKYVFPEGTVIGAGEYLLVFCDGQNRTDNSGMLHTNFSLGPTDKAIAIFSPQKLLCDSIEVFDLPDNISCGIADGETEPKLFARATPGRKNSTAWTELSVRPSPDINDGILISEVLSASSRKKGSYSTDYIEIYNSTSSEVNLKGYTLAQSPGEVFFTFPSVKVAAGGCVLVYCDGTSDVTNVKKMHAPIKISTGGEDFYLADRSGKVCDYFNSGKGRWGMSSGRVGGDTSKRVFFEKPSPGQPNGGKYYASFAPQPVFSVEGGVVGKGTKVGISVPEGYTVTYTTDGKRPTRSSKVYQSPVTVNKNTVIRAIAFSSGTAESDCVTQSYFISNPHTIPIVSMSGSKAELTGSNGILVSSSNGAEYRVHVEYFDESGVKAVEFECGAKHFGQYSLKYDQKGICLKLREIYGQSQVSYKFFNECDSTPTTFSSLLIRPSGQDSTRAKLRDEFVPAVIRDTIDIDYQEYRACAFYVNGEYWGLYYIRERLDDGYLKYHYGYEKGTYDLIKSQLFEQEGTIDEYYALTQFCKKNDLTVKKNYDYICSKVDIDSLINYWVIETYFGNYDTGNIRCYKTRTGKWRWMVYDFDWSMNSRNDMINKNYIDEHILDPAGHGAAHFENVIIRKLLQNRDFRDRFLTLYCYHIKYTFDPARLLPILNSMADKIDGEIRLNEERWGKPTYDYWKNKSVPFLREFVQEKPAIAYRQLRSSFRLSESELESYKAAADRMHASQ